MELRIEHLDTPVGRLELASDASRLLALSFPDKEVPFEQRLRARFGPALDCRPGGRRGDAARRLADYFAGDLAAIDAIDADPGGTDFQRLVWHALRAIPFGRTESYAALAARIGRPSAVRAVARANATNTVAVVLPCHRVIGSDGTLTGYGGGLERKRWLLRHEGAACAGGDPRQPDLGF